jgi:hypothetical protein
LPFQAQISVTLEHADLSLFKHYSFIARQSVNAVARMLLTVIFNILKKKESYNAELYRKSDVLPVSREITVEQAIILARTQGYRIREAS